MIGFCFRKREFRFKPLEFIEIIVLFSICLHNGIMIINNTQLVRIKIMILNVYFLHLLFRDQIIKNYAERL